MAPDPLWFTNAEFKTQTPVIVSFAIQSTLSKADTLGTRFTVRLREVSALERVHLT